MNEPADDIGADILAAVKEVQEASPLSPPDTSAAAPVDVKEAPITTQSGGDSNRGPDGKFLPKEKVETKDTAPAEKPVEQETTKPQTEAKDGAEPDKLAAPSTWKAEAKAIWKDLPITARQEIDRRERDIARTVQQKSEELNRVKTQFDEIEQVIAPRREALTVNYGSVGKAVSQLFAISDLAGKSPEQFVTWYSQQIGMDPKALLERVVGGTGATQQSPAVAPELQQRIAGLEGQLRSFQTQQEEATLAQRSAALQAVAHETDAAGNEVRPFWDELMTSGKLGPALSMTKREFPAMSDADVAKKAYERAVRLDDGIWDRSQQLRASRETEDKAKAERAAAAQTANRFTGGSPPNKVNLVPDDADTVDGAVRAAWKSVNGGHARI